MVLPLAAAIPAVSAALWTAGRYVVMTGIPAIARFAVAPSTVSAATNTLGGVGTVAKVVANNKVNTLLAGVAIDGALGTNMTGTALKGLGAGVASIGGVFADGAKNNIKAVTGVDLEGQTAPTPAGHVTSPPQQQETVKVPDENSTVRRAPHEQSEGNKIQRLVGTALDKAGDNPSMALGTLFGAFMGISGSSGMAEAAWKVPLYSAIMGFVFGQLLAPMLNPMLARTGITEKLSDLRSSFGGAANGQTAPQISASTANAPEASVSNKFALAGAGTTPDSAPVPTVDLTRRAPAPQLAPAAF